MDPSWVRNGKNLERSFGLFLDVFVLCIRWVARYMTVLRNAASRDLTVTLGAQQAIGTELFGVVDIAHTMDTREIEYWYNAIVLLPMKAHRSLILCEGQHEVQESACFLPDPVGIVWYPKAL